jgi:DNA-binding NarL/FixJ family response regulator
MNPPQPRTVLVVDDEAVIRRTLAKRLAKWQFKVITAENGSQALALMQSTRPQVVITDLFMPQVDGFELLRHLCGAAPELPVIVISGQGERGDVIKALRLGAWDYFYKPIENASFLRLAIDRVLEKAQLLADNRAYRDHLEELVAQQNVELLDQRKALVEKTDSLEKANTALKALLEQREIEIKAIEQTMVGNLKRFVFPYLDELESRASGSRTSAYLNSIRTNIEFLISPISNSLGGAYRDLTPAEIKVADLVRQGESTKSIAVILATSPSTVEKHRNSIRQKLNIVGKKLNLQVYLNSLS